MAKFPKYTLITILFHSFVKVIYINFIPNKQVYITYLEYVHLTPIYLLPAITNANGYYAPKNWF